MPGAVIAIDQARPGPSVSHGSPGVARKDLWVGWEVQLLDGAGGNTQWEWSLLYVPPGSAVQLSGADPQGVAHTANPTFTPDLPGTYRVRLITNSGGPGNIQIKIVRVRFDINGDLAWNGWALPAFGESDGESNYPGNLIAWAEVFEYIFTDIRGMFADIGSMLPAPAVEDVGRVLTVTAAGVASWQPPAPIGFSDGIAFPVDGTFSITQDILAVSGTPFGALISAQSAFPGDTVGGGSLTLKGGDPGDALSRAGDVYIDLGAIVSGESARFRLMADDSLVLLCYASVGYTTISAPLTLSLSSSAETYVYGVSRCQIGVGSNLVNMTSSGIELNSSVVAYQSGCQRVPTPTGGTIGGSSITPNFALAGDELQYTLTQATTTLNAPTNIRHGVVYTFKLTQGSANRTVTWNSVYRFGSASSVLSTTSGAIDYFVFKGDTSGTPSLRLLYAAKGVQ
jgi:hypothetical protein